MVSGEESGICGENGGAATSQENRGAAAACSSVASGATLTEIFEAAEDAIAAIEDGDIDIAKARLRPFSPSRGASAKRLASEPVSSTEASVAARRGSACEGQHEGEPGAAGRGLDPDLPAVGLDDSAGERFSARQGGYSATRMTTFPTARPDST